MEFPLNVIDTRKSLLRKEKKRHVVKPANKVSSNTYEEVIMVKQKYWTKHAI